LVSATHNGDIIVWKTNEIFKAVERRMQNDGCYESEEEMKEEEGDEKMNHDAE
jgi:hypothetical protein